MNKTVNIKVRVNEEQGDRYIAAAERSGVILSEWIRSVLDKASSHSKTKQR